MILYEKFGEDYDVVVGKMSHEEKMRLKEEVSKATPKTADELLGHEDSFGCESVSSATTGTSSFVAVGGTKLPLLIVKEEGPQLKREIVTRAFESLDSPCSESESIFEPPFPLDSSIAHASQTSLGDNIKKSAKGGQTQENDPCSQKNLFDDRFIFKTPTGKKSRFDTYNANHGHKTLPSYLRPTVASKLRSSPNKQDDADSPGVIGSCSKLFPDPLSGFGSRVIAKKAMGNNNRGVINLKNIVSPVGQYIRSNNTPQIMRNIRPKHSRFLEEELKDAEEADFQPKPEPKYFAPLPEARYHSTKVALEQKLLPEVSHKELPKSFGTVNTVQAVVSILRQVSCYPPYVCKFSLF